MNQRRSTASLRAYPVTPADSSASQEFTRSATAQLQFGNAAQEPRIRSYVLLLYNYRALICGVSVAVIFLALLRSFLTTPMYRSETLLRIGTYTPALQGNAREDSVAQQTRELGYLNTQIELLTSLPVADLVLADPNGLAADIKRYDDRYRAPGILQRIFGRKAPAEAALNNGYHRSLTDLQSYLELLSVKPMRMTSLVRLSAVTAEPELSARIANAHAERYIEYIRQERESSALENLVFLQRQAAELAEKVAASERKLAAYAEANAIVSVNKDANITVDRMSELSRMLTEAIARRTKSEAAWKESTTGAGIGEKFGTDQALERLLVAQKEAEGEYASLGEKFKANYPKMVELRAKVDSLRKAIEHRKTDLRHELEVAFNADATSEAALKEALELQKSETFDLSKREVQYNILKREYESLKDLHQSVLRQLKEEQISAERQNSNVAIAERAAVADEPVGPRHKLALLIGLLAGPALGFVLALAVNALDSSIKRGDEVAALTQLPVLGVVPDFEQAALVVPSVQVGTAQIEFTAQAMLGAPDDLDSDPAAGQAGALELLAQPSGNLPISFTVPDAISTEVFRAIRTSILLSASEENRPRVLLITSAKKGEGKTILSTNLAVTLAQAGHTAVIVDCDLRRPSVCKYFALGEKAVGLTEVITGQATLDAVLHESGIDRLYVIPSGQIPPNPAELIGSKKMEQVIEDLLLDFDYIILDSPPVLPVADSSILSKLADGVILVARAEHTPRALVKEASSRLRQLGARMLGVVLNGASTGPGSYGYFRHAYSYYYGDETPTVRDALREFKRNLRRPKQ